MARCSAARWLFLAALVALASPGSGSARGDSGFEAGADSRLAQVDAEALLARVPAGVSTAWVIPDLRGFSDRLAALATEMGVADAVPIDFLAMMRESFGVTGGVREDGPLVGWFTMSLSPQLVLLVPVDDFGAFAASFGAGPGPGVTAGTVSTWAMPVYLRQLEDYAVVALSAADAEAVTLTPASSLLDTAGELGRRAVATGDAAWLFNLDQLAPLLLPSLNSFWTMYADLFADPSLDPSAVAMMEAIINAYRYVFTALLTDTQVTALSLHLEPGTPALDWTWQFRPESQLARAFARSSPVGDRLANLPDRPYFFAGAVNLEGLALDDVLTELAGVFPEAGGGFASTMRQALDLMSGVEALAGAWYAPAGEEGLTWSDLLDFAAIYDLTDAESYRQAIREYTTSLSGITLPSASGGTTDVYTYRAEYVENARTLDGVSVDRYSVALEAPPGVAPGLPGSGWMTDFSYVGYVAAVGADRLIWSSGEDEERLRQLLTTSGGLGARSELAALRAAGLAEDPFFEGFLDLGAVLRFGLAASGLDASALPAVPEGLPPVGWFGYAGGGAVAGRIVVPVAVLSYLGGLVRSYFGDGTTPI